MPTGSWRVAGSMTALFLGALLIPTPLSAQDQDRKPDDSPPPRTDPGGDPLPEGAILRLGSLRFRHHGPIFSLAYSPDGKSIVSGGMDEKVRLWETATGKEIRTHKMDAPVNAVLFSPDGSKVLAGGGGEFMNPFNADAAIQIWDADTGDRIEFLPAISQTQRGLPNTVHSLALSSDGETLAAAIGSPHEIFGGRGGSTAVPLWRLSDGKRTRSLQGHSKGVADAAFSPDGKTLATVSGDRTLRFWDLESGEEERSVKIPGEEGTRPLIVYSPDGGLLACVGVDGAIRLWDPKTGKRLRGMLGGHSGMAWMAAFSPDGKTIASAGEDGTIRIGDLESREGLDVLSPPKRGNLTQGRALYALAYSPDGKTIAAAGQDSVIRFWEASSGKPLHNTTGHDGYISAVAFSPDGRRIASGSDDTTIRIWNTKTGEQETIFSGHSMDVRAVAFSPDGRSLASAGEDSSVRLWDPDTGKEGRSWNTDEFRGLMGGVVFPWGGRRMQLTNSQNPIEMIDYTPNGESLVATNRRGDVYRMEVEDGKRRSIWEAPEDVDPWGGLVIQFGGIFGGESLRWDLMSEPWRRTAALSQDGRDVVFRSDVAWIRACDVAGGKEWIKTKVAPVPDRENFNPKATAVSALDLSPDGQVAAIGFTTGSVRLLELATGKEIREWRARTKVIHRVAFSPDGRLLATAGRDGTIRLWSVYTGLPAGVLEGHLDQVFCLAFSPDGTKLASGSLDNTVLVWNLAELEREPLAKRQELMPEDLDSLWSDLAGEDAGKAQLAIAILATAPDLSLPIMKDRLTLRDLGDGEEFRRLIRMLDHDDFDVREKASEELRRLGPRSGDALKKALEENPSPEVRIRVKGVLESLDFPVYRFPSEVLRRIRAIQALEMIGSKEACEVLRSIAESSPLPREKDAASYAVARAQALRSW